jgi:hypothetical protein
MINLVEKKISFIHFSSNNYIHPPTSSKVSIHWKFIKHLSMFHQNFPFAHDFFTSMFFIHATFMIHLSSIHVSIIHFSSKIKICLSHLPLMLTCSLLMFIYSPNNVHVDLRKTSQKFIIQWNKNFTIL